MENENSPAILIYYIICIQNILLNAPPRNKRSKSPVASHGDLMNSIRNQDPNARLKKVEID